MEVVPRETSPMETLTNCPVCNHPAFDPFLQCKDHTVSRETYQIVQCGNCGFRFTNPRPGEAEIGKYYEAEQYVSHSNTSQGLINKIYQVVRKYTVRQKFRLVSKLTNGNKILDYGCGTGEFLNHCQQQGWKTTGFEPNAKARQSAIDYYGLDIKTENELFDNRKIQFDIITMWHVLEHVHQLRGLIGRLLEILAPQGALVVAVPNPASYDAKYYRELWAGYDVPRHLYHFSQDDVKTLFDSFGLHVEKILPMKFDAYYVSMLSEKHKNKNGNLISAFFKGLQSNLKARQPRYGYSSQIYILRRNGAE